MFARRNLINLLHPNEFFLLKKFPGACNFHETASKESKTSNFLHPIHRSIPFEKFFSKLTSAEMRERKISLLKEKGNPTIREVSKTTEIQRNMLRDFISSRTSATDEDWELLLQNVVNYRGQLNEFSINGKVMEYIADLKNLDLARDHLRYMKKTGKKFNQAVVTGFLSVCYDCQDNLTEEDLKTVRFFTNYMISNFKEMDTKLGSSTMKGLSILNDWEKSMEIAENLNKNDSMMSPSVYSPLIICLLKTQQFKLARKIMRDNLSNNVKLSHKVYLKWIEVFQHDPSRLEELLIIFKEYNVIPRKSTCKYLIEVYSQLSPEHRLRGKFTTVKFNGQCNSCKKTLEKNMLLEEEFNEVRDAFLNRVLVGDDVFKNTTPEELQSFYNVVKTHGPFDIVIDGLNVLYCLRGKSTQQKTTLLSRVVDSCFERDMNILVIGRKHMRNLPKRLMENIMEKSNIFLIDDQSEDDPFMIYATLRSGPKCYFVTNDYLRSEKFRLGDGHLSNLFKQWQFSHQLAPFPIIQGDFQNTLQFKLSIQRTAPQSWHIPYHDDDYAGTDVYERSELIKWLCLGK